MYDSIINNTLLILEKELDNKKAKTRLKKLFILECRYNLSLLDTTRWKDVDDEFKIEICKKLRVDAAKAIYSFTDKGMLSSIFKKVQKFSSESKNEYRNDSRIISLINRVDVLTTISDLPESVKHQAKTKYRIRIRNLRTLILGILVEITE
jgi:hypothetical protein